ncbi:KIF1-binding protein [Chloropicon primus]|nr:KIF1-binding protein [Chloropicon primus]
MAAPGTMKETWTKVEDLLKRRDPETEPYKSRYEAIKVLRDARERIVSGNETLTVEEEKAVAAIDHRIGLTKVSVDERGEGKEILNGCLEVLQKHEGDFVHQLQEAWNMLGIVNFERDLTSQALEYFKRAEDLYHGRKESASGSHFSLTLFYLAQAYSNLGEAEQGARYCALTLDMQLRTKTYATHDWTQNAVQLAGFYLDKAQFATAYNLLEAAKAVLREDIGELDDFIPSGGNTGDVPANLVLGWAKFYLRLLVASREWKLSGGAEGFREGYEVREEEVRPELRFESLDLAPCPFLTKSALFLDFGQARTVFNKGMTYFKRAMEHYKLDGWVTEHFQITMEVSALYRALATFETDGHRACVMHRKRSKRIEVVLEDLNPKYFPSVWKSGLLELADIYREIMEVKSSVNRPAGKVYKAGAASAQYYKKFIESFDDTDGGIENLEEDDMLYYIKARFELGRILQKLYSVYPEGQGDSRNSCMSESIMHLQWIEDFTEKHDVEGFAQERALCVEMKNLLQTKFSLLKAS